MIKIIIVDPEKMDASTLVATALYLRQLADRVPVAPVPVEPVPVEPVPVAPVPVEPVEPVARFNPFSRPLSNPDTGLDSAGMPWDTRIHTRTRSKDDNGVWLKKRGKMPETVTAVETELKAVMVPAPPALVILPPGSTKPAPMDFIGLMKVITGYITAGKLTRDQVNEIVQQLGLESLPKLTSFPTLIPEVLERINEVVSA